MGRHLLPGVAAGVLFLLLYLVLGFPITLAAAASVVGYLAAYLLLPNGASRTLFELESGGPDRRMIREVFVEAREHIWRLKGLAGQVSDSPAGKRGQRIVEIAEGILADLEKDPSEYTKARPFLEIYLPSSRKVMEQYVDLRQRGVRSTQIDATLTRADTMLERLVEAFESQRANLAELDLVNLDVELRLLDSTLKAENPHA